MKSDPARSSRAFGGCLAVAWLLAACAAQRSGDPAELRDDPAGDRGGAGVFEGMTEARAVEWVGREPDLRLTLPGGWSELSWTFYQPFPEQAPAETVLRMVFDSEGRLEQLAYPALDDRVDVTLCQARMVRLYAGLLRYRASRDELPQGSGVRFLVEIYQGGMEPTFQNAMSLTCTGVRLSELDGQQLALRERWSDLERLTGSSSAYAGRNCADYPLRKLSAKEPLVACDNADRANHGDITHVLYGDGSIAQLSLVEQKRIGVVPSSAPKLVVGPESPISDLRKLSLD